MNIPAEVYLVVGENYVRCFFIVSYLWAFKDKRGVKEVSELSF